MHAAGRVVGRSGAKCAYAVLLLPPIKKSLPLTGTGIPHTPKHTEGSRDLYGTV